MTIIVEDYFTFMDMLINLSLHVLNVDYILQ